MSPTRKRAEIPNQSRSERHGLGIGGLGIGVRASGLGWEGGRRQVRRAAMMLAGFAAMGAAQAQPTNVVVRFEQASYAVDEDAGSVEVCLVRSGTLDVGFFVFLSSEDGTATGGTFGQPQNPPWDYCSFTDRQRVFPIGETRICTSICIVNDSLAEGDEQFSVHVAELPSDVGQVGSPSVATVTIIDDDLAAEGLVVSFLDHGHNWPPDPLIPYEITVRNFGPPVTDLVVTEVVPVQTVFVAAESTPGWSCEPGPDEGGQCEFHLGDLATGSSQTIVFAVEVVAGTPGSFEVFNSFSLSSNVDTAAAPVRAATRGGVPPPPPGGPTQSASSCHDFVLPHGRTCVVDRITFDGLGCCYYILAGASACDELCLATCSN